MKTRGWLRRLGIAALLVAMPASWGGVAFGCGGARSGSDPLTTQPASPTTRSAEQTDPLPPRSSLPTEGTSTWSSTSTAGSVTDARGGTAFGPGDFQKGSLSAGALATAVAALVADDGVPVLLPDPLPPEWGVAARSPWTASGKNPWRWPMAGPRPGPRAAGYGVVYTDGSYLVRFDVNAAGDLGDVSWEDPGVEGVYGPLMTTSAAEETVVRVPNRHGVEILVWGSEADREELLETAAAVRLADP